MGVTASSVANNIRNQREGDPAALTEHVTDEALAEAGWEITESCTPTTQMFEHDGNFPIWTAMRNDYLAVHVGNEYPVGEKELTPQEQAELNRKSWDVSTYTDVTRTHPATRAMFQTAVDPRTRSILIMMHTPLGASLGSHPGPDRLSVTKPWGGIAFQEYAAAWRQMGASPEEESRLAHVVHVAIQDEETQNIIAKVLWERQHRGQIATFRAQKLTGQLLHPFGDLESSFDELPVENANTDTAFDALLGSQIGQQVAWGLLQHKAQLGNLRCVTINVFVDDRATQPNGPYRGPSMQFVIGEDK